MLRGHYWTLGPFVASLVRPKAPPPSRHFRVWARDSRFGKVRLTGRYVAEARADAALLVVHGLGGSAQSPYAAHAALAARAAGMSSLRMNLRGADLLGEDYYHAGLTSDLAAVIASPELARYERIFVLGYSLGGHVTLKYASEASHDPRVQGFAAVCPPVDLRSSATDIDRRRRTLYRAHVLRGLKAMYRRVAAKRDVPVSVESALRIPTITEWDERIIAPRFGFADAADYWAQMSVAPRLSGIRTPTLVVHAEADPMVLARTVRPVLDAAETVKTVWVEAARGGHVGFPDDLDLGFGGPPGLESQIVSWLTAR